jgi:hypothetical protein
MAMTPRMISMPEKAGGANAWSGLSVDEKRGLVFILIKYINQL